MHKSTFAKGVLGLLGLASLASAQTFKYWDVADGEKAPKTLSATGLYSNISTKTLIGAATYFEVNSALWSDATAKKRWFILKPNQKITFKENNDYWDYPDSTVFVKQFAVDTVNGDSTTRVLWETRFLILKKEAQDPNAPTKKVDQWYGFSYQWRADQSDADLVPDTGKKATILWYPTGKGPGKTPVKKKWIFPDRTKCLECHRTEMPDTIHGRSVLGFFTAQLNMPSPLTPGINQIEDFFQKGRFQGTKPADYAKSPRWYGLKSTDPNATLEKKARSYIASNCSGCHGDRGKVVGATFGVDLNYDYFLGTPRMVFEYKNVNWAYGLDNPDAGEPADHPTKGVYLVTPGYPEKSVILYRQISRNTTPADSLTGFDPDANQMPPLASFEVNNEAVQVISDWIKSLPQRPNTGISGRSRQAVLAPTVQGRNLILPPAMIPGNPRVSLAGVDGRVHRLIKTGPGVYLIPAHIPRGIYMVRVGIQSFTRYVF
jgi:hypothetical protein